MADTYLEALDAGIVKSRYEEGPRGHLGYSQIGKEDERTLWLQFRWCMPQIKDPRVLRIFDNGNMVEDMLIEWTHQSDIRLVTRAPDGKQFRFKRYGGHVAGSMDGAIFSPPEFDGEWGVWEAKSANDNRFKGLLKLSDGSGRPMAWDDLHEVGIKAWSPEYWGQCICYMGETGMRKALIVVYDKNTSNLHTEVIEADDMAFATLVSKAERIVDMEEPPTSLYRSPADWQCKLVMNEEERLIYWGERLPPTANCRNCRFSSPVTDATEAQWRCGLRNTYIGGLERQLGGCEKHQFIPALMPALKLLPLSMRKGEDDSGVLYETPEGLKFTNGPGGYASKELIELAKDEFAMLADPFFQQAREELGAKVVAGEDLWEEDIPF